MNLELVVEQVEQLPLKAQEEVLDFVEFLVQKYQSKEHDEKNILSKASEKSLQDWNDLAEEEAWASYQ